MIDPKRAQPISRSFIAESMETYGDSVYRLALSYMRNKPDAEDVYQEVFLKLFHHTVEFSGSEHAKAWLLRVTINQCKDLLRKKKRVTEVPFEELQYEPTSNPHLPEESAKELWELIGTLPEDQRAAIHLHFVEGYNSREIASMLDIQPSAVRMRIKRGRVNLKAMLGGNPYDTDKKLPAHDGRIQGI